jgi:hypothetical protein
VKVLVCGGRDYTDAQRVGSVLAKLNASTPVSSIVTGDAAAQLIALFDTAGGLGAGLVLTGSNVVIEWDNGVSKIFKL